MTRSFPKGRTKIVEALKRGLASKEFNAITTAEIARNAGVTEALIYKYFKDKRDLLHQTLAEYLDFFISQMEVDLNKRQGALNKLQGLVWSHINMYGLNRVFAKILLLEVRNSPDYFSSDVYQIVKRYSKMLAEIIEEGKANGEIRRDIATKTIRQLVLGGIEHLCLPGVIFDRDIPTDELTDELCELLFKGIASPKEHPEKR